MSGITASIMLTYDDSLIDRVYIMYMINIFKYKEIKQIYNYWLYKVRNIVKDIINIVKINEKVL